MENISSLLGKSESVKLEYKAVLPPAKSLAQIIASFANTEGGYIVLGAKATAQKILFNGLSADFHATSVTHKAIDLLTPQPIVKYENIVYNEKRLYIITIEKSDKIISIEGKVYTREGSIIKLQNPVVRQPNENKLEELKILEEKLENIKPRGTDAQCEFVNHYISIINIADRLAELLYPSSSSEPTDNQDGKILTRILYSSCADNFETYLSDLLYEIYLAKPDTLKSTQEVTIKEVLDCSDMQEFIAYWSKKKLSKLQRGSVKGFLSENKQIEKLNVIDKQTQDEIEKILQIRHLYAHRNGIVDEKFLKFHPSPFQLNEEHRLSISDIISHLTFLVDCVIKIDEKAIEKYDLNKLS